MEKLVRLTIFTILLSALLLVTSAQRRGQNNRHRAEQDILASIIKPEVKTNPGGNETHVGATTVHMEIYVRNIDLLDEQNQELHFQLTLRMRWFDSRFAFSQSNSEGLQYVTLDNADISKVWTPGLFVGNEKSAVVHDFATPNKYYRIFPNGEVLYSQRVSLATTCALNFRNFPFDRQHCQVRMASYANTNLDVVFLWKKENPVQITTQLTLPKFAYESYETGTCDSTTTTGTYSCVTVTFNLRRLANYYLVHIFIPCFMLAIVSWLSFWLAPKELLGRIIITIVSLGLMVIQVTNFNESTGHQVSYTRAVDTFTGISLTFLFWAFVQTIIVNYWVRKESENGGEASSKAEETGLVEDPETEALKPSDVESGKAQEQTKKQRQKIHPEKYFQSRWSALKSTSQKIDWVVRIVYPVLFILFNIVFFSVAATRN